VVSVADETHEVLWLTPDKPEDISVGRRRLSVHLCRRGFEVTLRGTTLRNLQPFVRDADAFDAILATTRAGAIAGSALKLLGGTPLVVDHVDPIRQFTESASRPAGVAVRWLEHRAFGLADHVLYVYAEEEARVRRYAASCSRTDLGVEYDRFADPSPEAIDRATATLDAEGVDGRVAVYVGGLEPIYHVRELLSAVKLLDGWSLLVLGDGSLSEHVESVAAERPDVVYPGTVPHDHVPGYLRVADVGVSLVDDPHTLKVLEYGAAGLPVVQLAGRAEERFGDLLEYCDASAESIANACRRADGRETSDLQSFASRFDWAEIADDYANALRMVM
jgi:glycosyltransferase involved in cell wall biosynthesis